MGCSLGHVHLSCLSICVTTESSCTVGIYWRLDAVQHYAVLLQLNAELKLS